MELVEVIAIIYLSYASVNLVNRVGLLESKNKCKRKEEIEYPKSYVKINFPKYKL